MDDSTKCSTDAGESSGFKTPEAKRNRMALYMRDRRMAKLVGLTVKAWRDAGRPSPDTGANDAPQA